VRPRALQHSLDSLRQVPVPIAEEFHQGRNEDRVDYRRVEQDCCREADAELLQAYEGVGGLIRPQHAQT
jgi:hypothetical protein